VCGIGPLARIMVMNDSDDVVDFFSYVYGI